MPINLHSSREEHRYGVTLNGVNFQHLGSTPLPIDDDEILRLLAQHETCVA
jgi:hypothetical protein